jgi:ubiquinone/menaquinone biosynthesis C-methylase UbiE
MVSLVENKSLWDGSYQWGEAGDEWSAPWGTVAMQWHGTLLPRIRRFLPTGTILEIACGYGRWTQFLQQHCDRLIGVDLSQECIDGATKRFAADPRLSFFANDGKSLAMVPDDSVDFIFSFDSLVHVDSDTLDAYFGQFRRILRRNGAAFIHHSNNGECAPLHPRRIPKLRYALRMLGVLEFQHLRDLSVSAAEVERLTQRHGLACVGQEVHTWLTNRTYLDCFSVIVRRDSPAAAAGNKVVRNPNFAVEANSWLQLSGIYSGEREARFAREQQRQAPAGVEAAAVGRG